MNTQIKEEKSIIVYQSEDGQVSFDVQLDMETVWLSQAQIVKLFERDKSVISRHIKNIFDEEELNKKSVVAYFATTSTDGKIYQVEHFNLDVVISIGYRIVRHEAVA